MTNDFYVEWNPNPHIREVDVLPADLIARNGDTIKHRVLTGKGKLRLYGHARCVIKVEAQKVSLDYKDKVVEAFNIKRGMVPGVLEILRKGVTNLDPRELSWKPKTKAKSGKFSGRLTNLEEIVLCEPYKRGRSSKKLVLRLIAERQQQTAFREDLALVYGEQCCISGCAVLDALEAAHIDPFTGEKSNNPQNGLLLRGDLHALFDRGHLAFDPRKKFLAYFSEDARQYDEYRKWHGRTQLRAPNNRKYSPCEAALKRRWKEFVDAQQ